MAAAILILAAVVSAGLISYYYLKHSGANPEAVETPQVRVPEAELLSATGMILVRSPGRKEWREVHPGVRLKPGTLVRTDSAGSASIRYPDGTTIFIQKNTIFTVQSAGQGAMEITSPPQIESLIDAKAEAPPPSLELHRIVPFGRSLELIGKVDAGSRLTVNDKIVDVYGDGSFKHFMDPFPASTKKAELVLKVTNLAGRSRILKATYDFRWLDGDN
jgi:hypothetical protein